MIKKIIIGAALFTLILTAVACASSASTSTPPPETPDPDPPTPPSGPIEATWIEPTVAGDTVSIPLSEVENNWNVNFGLETPDGDTNFMAQLVEGEIYVRANACPPCHSIGFALQGDILVCDTCATTFEATTGEGITGACVDYPKAAVPYQISDGNIVMSQADLAAAYQDTLNPGWP